MLGLIDHFPLPRALRVQEPAQILRWNIADLSRVGRGVQALGLLLAG